MSLDSVFFFFFSDTILTGDAHKSNLVKPYLHVVQALSIILPLKWFYSE